VLAIGRFVEKSHVHLPVGQPHDYFTEGVVRAWGDKGWSSGLALAQTILCVILFAACALHVRWRFQMAREGVSLDDSQESKPLH